MNKARNIKIVGIAACVPKRSTDPFHLLDLEPSEILRISSLIGVNERRVSAVNQCSSDLCIGASETLLTDLSWARKEIGFLLFLSQTPDYRLPATAPILQHRLGLPVDCVALDINLGCSAYVYGLHVLASLMAFGEKKKGLLLVGDTPTKFISPKDRTTSLLFGDAGTATALEYIEGQEDWFFDMGCDGARHKAIIIPGGGYRNSESEMSFAMCKIDEGIIRNQLHLVLYGLEVFNFALREPINSMKNIMTISEKGIMDIDYFILHQANFMMNEQIRKKLKIPTEKCPTTLAEFGNTSSASIPLTMVSKLGESLRTQKLVLLLCGFGVGLSWGSVILNTERIVCPEVTEQ
jgi:3-oxoacyl-[acyl-carrier-protein] synthase-3